MEGTQQREQRRGRESRPRGGRNAGARPERSPRENKPEKPQQNEKPRDNQRERRPRLAPINLRRNEKDIKLNDEQQKQVFELDQKIGKFGKIEIPSFDERDKKNKEFETETERLQSQMQNLRDKVDEITKKIENFDAKHDPHKKEHDDIRAQIKKIDDVLKPTLDKLKTLREQKIQMGSKLKDVREKTPGRSMEDIDMQIEELEYQIETSTLSNAQLKSKLSQIESLKKSKGAFGNAAVLQNSITHIKEDEQTLYQQKKKMQEERDKLYAQIHEFTKDNGEFKAARDKLWAEKKAVFDQMNDLRKKIDAKYTEKKEYNNKFFENVNVLRKQRDEQAVFIHTRLQIFQDAERHMDLLEKGANKAGEIKERKNPNEEKISAARSLIGFLQSKLAFLEEKEAAPAKKVEKTVVETEESRLISSIRKPSKKERKNAKKEEKPKEEKPKTRKLNFTLDSLQQFTKVGVNQPTAPEEIPKVINELKKKVAEWTESFVKVVLNFDVQPDGSIKSEVKFA